MHPDRWKRINSIFHDALDLPPGERQRFVAAATIDDKQLRSDIEALLYADERAGNYLESPLLAQNLDANDEAMLPAGTLLCQRFRIVRKIAEGGMGQVYEALDSELGLPVALKAIRPEIGSDPAVLARFRQEVKLARRITHPNVCRTYDFERDVIIDEARDKQRDIYFLTMEFLPGETLASRIRRTGPLSSDDALAIARQIAGAIDSAHSLGIVHRDLKPGNLMLASWSLGESSEDPRAVITDFGLARVTPLNSSDDAPTISKLQGWPIGTMAYMSPEQLEGLKISAATDIYYFRSDSVRDAYGQARIPFGEFSCWYHSAACWRSSEGIVGAAGNLARCRRLVSPLESERPPDVRGTGYLRNRRRVLSTS